MTRNRGVQAKRHAHQWEPFIGAEKTLEQCMGCLQTRAKPKRAIPATNEITMFLHCGLCLAERPPGQSPREFAQLEVGWTPLGIQLWCKRHEVNVLHMDFDGQQHRLNTTRLRKPGEGVKYNLTELV